MQLVGIIAPTGPATRWAWLGLLLLLAGGIPLAAQETGQICARAYHDRDGNGARDADEAPVTRGIGASAFDERGVTIATQLLVDSPFAADGLLCLDQLAAGEYLVLLSSSEYSVTSASSLGATVETGAPPPLLEFGVRSDLAASAASVSQGSRYLDPAALQALVIAALGGGLVFLLMTLVGAVSCLVIIRRQRRRSLTRGQTGALPAASPYEQRSN